MKEEMFRIKGIELKQMKGMASKLIEKGRLKQ